MTTAVTAGIAVLLACVGCRTTPPANVAPAPVSPWTVPPLFPECSVANYDGVFSSRKHPAWTVWGAVFPPMGIGRFSASMPDVYGSDAMFNLVWYGSIFEPFHLSAPLQFLRHRGYRTASQEKADRVYTRVMLALDRGAIMNTAIPSLQDTGVVWSCVPGFPVPWPGLCTTKNTKNTKIMHCN
jgi:hypothetical protein